MHDMVDTLSLPKCVKIKVLEYLLAIIISCSLSKYAKKKK